MANIRIAYINHIDASGVTDSGTSEATGYERDYLYGAWKSPSYIWRSTSTATQNIQFDLGSAKAVNVAALWNHNLTSSATIRVQADNNSDYLSLNVNTLYDALDSDFDWANAPDDEQRYFLAFFNSQTYRYWRFQLSNTSNPDGYVSAGRAWFGQYWTPDSNVSWGYGINWEDPSEIVRTSGGVLAVKTRTMYRSMNLLLNHLTQTEDEEMMDIKRLVGRTNDVIVSAYPDDNSARERQNAILGHITDSSSNTHRAYGLNSVSLQVEEAI